MQSITKDEMEAFIGRLERASAGFRSSLSPSLVKEWNDHIKLIPLMAERIENIKADSDKVSGIETAIARHEEKIAANTKADETLSNRIWGLLVLVLGSFLATLIK